MELAQGTVVADRFRLVRPLGQGGMGAVWLAQHTGLDVPCAVKFIHEHAAQSAEVRTRFEREAKAAAQLRSPHVVQILDHGVWQGAPYIAMELLEGEDLGQRLRRVRTLSPRETLAIATQVGRALAKAHAAGLVHRDLKPGNVFIVRDDEREIAKVLDFGVAKVMETDLDGSTKTGAVLGTPFYMSPEQARGSKSIDHRSDLWALAVVVYQCLTGALPFRGESLGDLFVKIIVEPLPVPSQIAPVPPDFDAWWAHATARDPAQRFQSAKELTEALGAALGVTVGDDVAVGSSAASGPTPRAPAEPTPGAQPLTPPGRLSTPSTSEAALPTAALPTVPLTPPGSVTTEAPTAAWRGSEPTPMQQAISVGAAPRSGRGVVAGAVVGVLALGAVGGFLAFRGGASSATTDAHAVAATTVPSASATTSAVTTAAPPPPASAPTPSAASGPTPRPPAEASASSAAVKPPPASPARAAPAPAPKATVAPAGPVHDGAASGPKPRAPAEPKSKTDFGF